MNIVCVICSDSLTPSDDVFFTPCGHIFHFVCLTQWLERSKTCPQCREKTTQSRIHRIYFNFSNNDTILEDSTSLQAMVDNLKFQLMVKEREIKQALTKSDTHKKESAGLRAEVRKLENEITHKETAILALKEQTRFFKGLSTEAEDAKKEVTRLKKKLDEYRCIQLLINAPAEETDNILANTRDPDRLLTYISVMKKELTASVARRQELRISMRKLQQELTAVSMERNFLLDERENRKKLEDLLAVAELEKKELESRVKELESGIPAEKVKKAKSQISENNQQAAGSSKTIIDLCANSPILAGSKQPREILSIGDDEEDNEENAPLFPLPFNICGEVAKRRKKKYLASKAYPLLAKKARLAPRSVSADRESSEMTYDGYGGHAKADRFPSPVGSKKLNPTRKPAGSSSTMRAPLDDGKNQKLSNYVNLDP